MHSYHASPCDLYADLALECLCAVGQLAAHCAFVRGAEKVAIIDNIEYRLQFAKDRMPNIETINFDKVKVRMPAPLLSIVCIRGRRRLCNHPSIQPPIV